VRALKGLALPRASSSGKISLVGRSSVCLRSTHAAAPASPFCACCHQELVTGTKTTVHLLTIFLRLHFIICDGTFVPDSDMFNLTSVLV
jgi:hypothetical protein